jgi:hypothetical protein
MWGNDPELTPEAYAKGEKPKESHITDAANTIMYDVLKGKRADPGLGWGWNGRLNGPGISRCYQVDLANIFS